MEDIDIFRVANGLAVLFLLFGALYLGRWQLGNLRRERLRESLDHRPSRG